MWRGERKKQQKHQEAIKLMSSKTDILKDFTYLFLERREGEREGEKHQYVVASHALPTGDLAHSLGMCPD